MTVTAQSDQRLCCLLSQYNIIPSVCIYSDSRLQLAPIAAQSGLSLTRETSEDTFYQNEAKIDKGYAEEFQSGMVAPREEQ